MKIIDLQNQINANANEIKSSYKSGIKSEITKAINKILQDNEIDATATYDYGDRSNSIRIVPKGLYYKQTGWSIYVDYKTSRKTIKESWRGNEYEYTLKSIEIYSQGKRKIGDNEEIEITTFEEYLLAEEFYRNSKKNQAEAEKEELKQFMQKNPEFEKMVELYNKYKYNLD